MRFFEYNGILHTIVQTVTVQIPHNITGANSTPIHAILSGNKRYIQKYDAI